MTQHIRVYIAIFIAIAAGFLFKKAGMESSLAFLAALFVMAVSIFLLTFRQNETS